MRVFDYYSGFEGAPEIRIIQRNKAGQNVALLRLWIAYFDAVIELIAPNDKDIWERVTLHYHSATGRNDNEFWECDDIPLFLKQLESIDENKLKESELDSIERTYFDVFEILKSMLKDTIDSKERILIEYY